MTKGKRAIVDILEEHGESLLDDTGVDKEVAENIADEIIKIFTPKPTATGRFAIDIVKSGGAEARLARYDSIGEAVAIAEFKTNEAVEHPELGIIAVCVNDMLSNGLMWFMSQGKVEENVLDRE